ILNLVDVQDSSSALNHSDDNDTLHFPFSFCFQEERQAGKAGRTYLPSSLQIGPCPSPHIQNYYRSAQASVRYQLQAYAYHDEELQATAFQTISLYDSIDEAPPPISLDHFPGEYIMQQQGTLRNKRLRSRGKLSVSASEPAPLSIRQNRVPLIGIPICLSLSPSTRNRSVSRPGTVELDISSHLRSTTTIAVARMRYTPTKQQILRCPRTEETIADSRPHRQKMLLSDWRRASHHTPPSPPTPSSSLSEKKPVGFVWTANTTLWVPLLDDDAAPVPSFFTTYLARRYSVVVKVKVKGEGRATFRLCVPLQILYAGVDSQHRPDDVVMGEGSDTAVLRLDEMIMRLEPEDVQPPIYVR
ncbi:hypothetical protein LTS18_011408, partial [Coniosporium uncinatum]